MASLSDDDARADSAVVDNAERGQTIRRRRMALGIRSVSELAERSGVSRSATTAAEHGEGARGTYERLEAWLSELERAEGSSPESSLEQIEFTVEGDFGVKVTVRGPITDRAALQESVAEIIKSIRAGD